MSYMHAPEIVEPMIVLSNSRKDLLAVAMRDALEAENCKRPIRKLPAANKAREKSSHGPLVLVCGPL